MSRSAACLLPSTNNTRRCHWVRSVLKWVSCLPPQLTKVLSKYARRLFLGELLVHTGVISQSQLKAALTLQQQRKPRKKLGDILVENSWLDRAGLTKALQRQVEVNTPAQPRVTGKFDALVEAECLTQEQLDQAYAEARNFQLPIEAVLLEKYHLNKQEIGYGLSVFYQCPFLEYDENRQLDTELVSKINLKYLRTNTWIPLKMTDDSLEVLLDDPYAFEKLQDIKRVFPGKQLKSIVGLKEDILKYVDAIAASLTPQPVEREEQPEQPQSDAPEDLTTRAEAGPESIPQEMYRQPQGQTQDKTQDHVQVQQVQVRGQAGETFTESTLSQDSGAVVRLVNQIIEDACQERASDIHIEPQGEEHELRIRLRIDGYCYDYRTLPASARKPLVSRLKVMAQLDIAERRKPQEGKMKVSLPDGDVEVRVTTLPTTGIANEDVVLRILTSSEKRSFDQLQMTQRNQDAFHDLLTKPSGLILCVGPTGTGKTTTLHAALETINTPQRKIWTAEDPVEITQRGLRQLQVQPKIGLTFAAAIRSLLRADPDVIMIGEIRDRETTEVCIDAALTGHLVLSTLHTNNATETVSRLLEMGMDPFTFADTLLGVMAQRLARTICQSCRESYHPPKDEYDALAYGYGETAFAELNIAYDNQFVLYRGSGCDACRNTGYKGRVGLHELLVATDEIKTGIRTRSQAKELFHTATTQGMTTLIQDGILKVLQGWTDYNQVKAVASR